MNRFFSPFNPFDEAAKLASDTAWTPDDPTPCPDWVRGLIGRNVRDWISSKVPGYTHIPNQADYDSPLYHPHAIRYHFSSRGRQIHPGLAAPFAPWRVELARFQVPIGYVGIVRSFGQYLAFNSLPGWTVLDTVGNPFADADAGIPGTWIFRLSPFDGTSPPWISQLNPIPERPGFHYADMPENGGVWYPAGTDAEQSVRLTVPSGYSLRVFWQSTTSNVQPAVGASFKGQLQGSYSPRSLDVTRGQWT